MFLLLVLEIKTV